MTNEKLSLPGRIAELIDQHGSLRAAARVLECDAGYLSRLQSGEKTDPGAPLLRRMGLRQIITFERIKAREASPLDRQIARAQEDMKSWSPEKHANMQLQGPDYSPNMADVLKR